MAGKAGDVCPTFAPAMASRATSGARSLELKKSEAFFFVACWFCEREEGRAEEYFCVNEKNNEVKTYL